MWKVFHALDVIILHTGPEMKPEMGSRKWNIWRHVDGEGVGQGHDVTCPRVILPAADERDTSFCTILDVDKLGSAFGDYQSTQLENQGKISWLPPYLTLA